MPKEAIKRAIKWLAEWLQSCWTYDSARTERRLARLTSTLSNPALPDWHLSSEDEAVISSYIRLFMRDGELKFYRMVVSADLYPELYRFCESLKGNRSWEDYISALDYLEEHWPEISPLVREYTEYRVE